jgi:hypothetical protein
MGKSAPAAPDYTGAAREQAQSSREVTEQQTWANRPDQVTPWGTTTWQNTPQWDPSTRQYINRWQQSTELNPESQRALNAQLGLTTGRSELGASLFPRMQQEFGKAIDWSQFEPGGGRVEGGGYYQQEAGDAIYNQWADRALPQQEEARNQLQTRLYNMGIKEGDQAYDREMEKLGQQQSDAQRQAAYQATIGSGAEGQRMQGMDISAGGYNTTQRQQAIAEEMQRRGFSLNEINAIISGQQVGMPSMPGFSQAQRSEGMNALQAAQLTGQADLDRFNAQQAATQGMMSGIGSMAGGFMMSDRRLKRNVRRIGSVNGINLYSFEYLWGERGTGVMADEVAHIPGAVKRTATGFDAVNYGVILR